MIELGANLGKAEKSNSRGNFRLEHRSPFLQTPILQTTTNLIQHEAADSTPPGAIPITICLQQLPLTQPPHSQTRHTTILQL